MALKNLYIPVVVLLELAAAMPSRGWEACAVHEVNRP